jgi:hypothetical protein
MDEFHAKTEGPRDRLAARARAKALRIMTTSNVPEGEQRRWMSHGRQLEEVQLVADLAAAVTPL